MSAAAKEDDAERAQQQQQYGTSLTTRRQFALVVAALCAGTLIEWYDFTVFSQLGPTISALFFPPGASHSVQQIGFFSSFAVGYLARPLGALVFGHVGDSRGRRPALLITVLGITAPTVLIGCLPTYEMAGIAAPLLLVILRFLQGLSLGGEYGSAICFLYEVAPPNHKGLLVGIGEGVTQFGIVVGVVAVSVVVAACSPQQLLVFGWRIPFLLSIVSASFAIVLRLHMPESHEFLVGRDAATKRRVAAVAAKRILSRRAATLRRQKESADGADAAAATPDAAPSGVGRQQSSSRQLRDALQARSFKVLEQQQQVPTKQQRTAGVVADADKDVGSPAKQPDISAAADGVDDVDVQAAVEEARARVHHHVPLLEIARHHLPRLFMHGGMLAFYGGFFYLHFVFVPSVLIETGRQTELHALLIQILNMLAVLVGAPLAGALADRGLHKVRCYAALIFVLGAACVPIQLALSTGPIKQSQVLAWVIQPAAFVIIGAIAGLQNMVGAQLWPAAVRTTGYCFAYSCALALAGGLTPLAASAIRLAMPRQDTTIAGGVWLVALCVVSLTACGAILLWAPEVDRRDSTEFLLRQQGLLPPLGDEGAGDEVAGDKTAKAAAGEAAV